MTDFVGDGAGLHPVEMERFVGASVPPTEGELAFVSQFCRLKTMSDGTSCAVFVVGGLELPLPCVVVDGDAYVQDGSMVAWLFAQAVIRSREIQGDD